MSVYSNDAFTRATLSQWKYENPPAGVAVVLVNVGSDEPVMMFIDLHDGKRREVVFEEGKVSITVDEKPTVVASPDDTLIKSSDHYYPGAPPEVIVRTHPLIQDLLKNGKTIQAIKELRGLTNLGLKESKDVVDAERARLRGIGINPNPRY